MAKTENGEKKDRTPEELLAQAIEHNKRLAEKGIIISQEDLIQETKLLNRTLYGVQKFRIGVGQVMDDRMRREIPISQKLINIFANFLTLEKNIENQIADVIDAVDVWKYYIKYVGGISYKLGSSLIAECDPTLFDTSSKMLAYIGQTANYVIGHCEHGHKLVASSENSFVHGCPVLKNNGKPTNDEEEGDEEFVETDKVGGVDKKTVTRCGGKVTIVKVVRGEAPRRLPDHHFLFNTRGKVVAWKIAHQFLHWKQGPKCYQDIYLNEDIRLNQIRYDLIKDIEKSVKIKYTTTPVKVIDKKALKLNPNIQPIEFDRYSFQFKKAKAFVTKENITGDVADKILQLGKLSSRWPLMARRKVIKVFIFNYWRAARLLAGLSVRPPYTHEYLGHSKMIDDNCFNPPQNIKDKIKDLDLDKSGLDKDKK